MEQPKCPECDEVVPEFTTNKKGQLVGRCAGCKKWVTLASAKEEQPAGKPAAAKAPAGISGKAAAPAARSGKPAASPAKPAPAAKQRTVRPGQRVPPQSQPAAVARDNSLAGSFRRILNFKL
jgi:hypothetical protein